MINILSSLEKLLIIYASPSYFFINAYVARYLYDALKDFFYADVQSENIKNIFINARDELK